MQKQTLTPEQEQVVHHAIGQHARVLAVAGSGKSTTMAHRIQYLVQDQHIRPGAILVLMFNTLARKQFTHHLDKIGLSPALQPPVHTFHSFSFHMIGEMVKSGALPGNTQFWLADKSELIWLTVKRAIANLEKVRRILPDSVDPQDALNSIGLWKGSLIPPQRAGSYTSPYLPLIYQEFEQLRLNEHALTFDDFIPLAVDILEHDLLTQQRYSQDLRHLIVDEYQDINYGQQRLIELLAGDHVDLMVVGDDDQTIYEWRGARPNYIIQDFACIFNGKPVQDYRLSRSFRFGPLIAQCAANVISCNQERVDKPLVAFQPERPGFIHVFDGGYNAVKELTEQVLALTQVDEVPPAQIIILARLFAQLDNLEAEFLARGIPYRVDGQQPFYKRQEINALLDYIRLAHAFEQPMNDESGHWLLNIANKPSRMLSRSLLERLISSAKQRRTSCQSILEASLSDPSLGLSRWQHRYVEELFAFLRMLYFKLQTPMLAGDLLAWMVDELGYLEYFKNYYGDGEHSDDKMQAVGNFIRYVTQLRIQPLTLLEHLSLLDTTQGKPEKDLIVFTTIFRTKGLEYDYVILPQCDENLLPYLKGELTDVYDTQGIVRESSLSSTLESERRLFYVALTRARKGVLIGTSTRPSRFIDEIQLPETEAVMGPVQWLAVGDPQAEDDLLQAVRGTGQQPIILNNLIKGYLPDMGEYELAEAIEQAAKSATPTVGVVPEANPLPVQ